MRKDDVVAVVTRRKLITTRRESLKVGARIGGAIALGTLGTTAVFPELAESDAVESQLGSCGRTHRGRRADSKSEGA